MPACRCQRDSATRSREVCAGELQHALVEALARLAGQRDDVARLVAAAGEPRAVQQQQRGQRVSVGMGCGWVRRECACEPDRVPTDVARHLRFGLPAGVEHQQQRVQHRVAPGCELVAGGHGERHVAQQRSCAGQPLRQGRLVGEQTVGDERQIEATQRAQRECHLRCGRQHGWQAANRPAPGTPRRENARAATNRPRCTRERLSSRLMPPCRCAGSRSSCGRAGAGNWRRAAWRAHRFPP